MTRLLQWISFNTFGYFVLPRVGLNTRCLMRQKDNLHWTYVVIRRHESVINTIYKHHAVLGVYEIKMRTLSTWALNPQLAQHPHYRTPPLRFIIIVIIKNHRWWDLTIVTQPHRFCKHWYSFGWKPDVGRNRPKHVVFYHPLINIIRYICCVIDLIPPPVNTNSVPSNIHNNLWLKRIYIYIHTFNCNTVQTKCHVIMCQFYFQFTFKWSHHTYYITGNTIKVLTEF